MTANVGRLIYGFCNGYFGRDDYSTKRIESEGVDWIVCRYSDSDVSFASFENEEEKQEMINRWSKEEEY